MTEQDKQNLRELESRYAVIDQIRVRVLRCMDDISGQHEDDDIMEALDDLDNIIIRRLNEIKTAMEVLEAQ